MSEWFEGQSGCVPAGVELPLPPRDSPADVDFLDRQDGTAADRFTQATEQFGGKIETRAFVTAPVRP